MKKHVYWQAYEFPNYIVREFDALFEEYQKGIGWVENRERVDIISGVDPYYSRITEEEALAIIKSIESKQN